MFQKISGNIISGRSRDILWRSLEIYRKKPGTHSSKIGKAMKNSEKIQVSGSRHCNFPASKKSKFLALPLPAWMVDTQGFIRFIFAGSWWASPKWNSSFRAWHWALPRSQLFFLGGRRIRGFHVSFSHCSPWFCPKSCGFLFMIPRFSELFYPRVPSKVVPSKVVPSKVVPSKYGNMIFSTCWDFSLFILLVKETQICPSYPFVLHLWCALLNHPFGSI